MAILPVLKAPDPRLKVKADPVEKVDDAIRTLMDDMLETMYANDGMGLAATQVGVHKRVVVMDFQEKEGEPPCVLKMANPEIIWKSNDKVMGVEACLSVPDQQASVERCVAVKVRYLDEDNKQQERETDGILAVCIQHEIDHLDGILYIDHLSRLKREIILSKLMKARKLHRL